MFPLLRRLKLRQWLPVASLLLGLIASFVGAQYGQPNSWLWFGGGVALAVVLAVITRRRTRMDRSPNEP